MTNFERYKDEIEQTSLKTKTFCDNFVVPKMLKPMGYDCNNIICALCSMRFSAWLMEEYKEPEVDWSKVPVDTKIYVTDYKEDGWVRAYFAKYELGKVYTWSGGGTSWSCNENQVIGWGYATLAEGENE